MLTVVLSADGECCCWVKWSLSWASWAHEMVLIYISIALIQTPEYIARSRILGQYVLWCVCLFPSLCRYWLWTNCAYSQRDGHWPGRVTWVCGYIQRWFIHSQMFTYPSTNQSRRRANTLIETNTLSLIQTASWLILRWFICLLMDDREMFAELTYLFSVERLSALPVEV